MCINISCAEMEGAGLFSVVPSDGAGGSGHKFKMFVFWGFFCCVRVCKTGASCPEKLWNHCLWRY